MEPTEAILIRLTKLTDTSLIVHWFTEGQGLVKTVAKGARRAKSPFAGRLDLFFTSEMTFSAAKRGDLHALRETVTRQWREELRKNYLSTLLAAYCCQLLELAVEPEHADPDLFDLLRRALDHLNATPPSLRAMRHFESELARILGVAQSQRAADLALQDALGGLPPARGALVERLAGCDDFDSSAGGNAR